MGLFGKKRREPREAVDALLPAGSTVDVVGESFYQAELAEIAGGKSAEGCSLQKWAYLIREPSNPYDRNAVAIFIDGRCVGYLSRGDAVEYGRLLDDMWDRYSIRGVCRASISGGWRRFAPDGQTVIDEGFFGVRLALSEPKGLIGNHKLHVLSAEELAAGPPLVAP